DFQGPQQTFARLAAFGQNAADGVLGGQPVGEGSQLPFPLADERVHRRRRCMPLGHVPGWGSRGHWLQFRIAGPTLYLTFPLTRFILSAWIGMTFGKMGTFSWIGSPTTGPASKSGRFSRKCRQI